MFSLLLLFSTWTTLTTATVTARTIATATTLRRSVQLGLANATDNVTLVEPHLDADTAEGGVGLVEAVVDFCTKGVQWHTAFVVALGAGHLSTAQTAGALNLDALDVWLTHCGLNSLSHRAAECHAVCQLVCNGLRYKLSVCIDVLDLEDVEGNLLAGELLQLTADAVSLGSTTADDDARTSGVDVHTNAVAGAFDDYIGDTSAFQAFGQELADLDVFSDVILVLLVGVPVGLPVGSDSQPEAVRMNLLAHYLAPSFWEATTTVMWLVRLRIWNARPWARGW